MNIAGIIKNSFIDFPGEISAVVFTQGCNMSCPYCHNPELNPTKKGSVSEKEVLEFLRNRKKYLSGVVITGGEPTLQKGLDNFLAKVKALGYSVKLDTNGSNPEVLKRLFGKGLLNYLAMDVKASLKKYGLTTLTKGLEEKIVESISIIKNSGVEHEFRMTAVPGLLTKKDLESIGELVKDCKLFALQQFVPDKVLNKKFANVKPFSIKELEEFAKIMESYALKVAIRNT